MLTKEELAKYLKYGWVSDYDYPDPLEKTKRNYHDLVNELEALSRDSILETYTLADIPVYLLSGGPDSTLVASQVGGIETAGITNWNMRDAEWAIEASNTIGTYHVNIETENEFTEYDLKRIQTWFDKPYSLLLGFFWFLTAKSLMGIGYDTFIDGNGPDHSMMEDHGNKIIELAAYLGQYDYKKAQSYLRKSFLRNTSGTNELMLKMLKREHTIDRYIDSLPLNQFRIIFDDDEVKALGLEPFKLELREESIDHIDELLFHMKEESANQFYQMIEDTLGCKGYHPLRRKDILDVCRQTPYEIKNALGIQKLPYREICYRWVGRKFAARPKRDWIPTIPPRNNWTIGDWDFNYPIVLDSFKELIDIYLRDKSRKIYYHLDYNKLLKYYNSQPPGITRFSRQIWNLLNLSIWMECHDD